MVSSTKQVDEFKLTYENGSKYFDYILEHDLETNELTMLETKMPVGMSCFSIGYYQNNIFLFGGNGSDGGSSIYKFDLETCQLP